MVDSGFRAIEEVDRRQRFLGKVEAEATARCRGGGKAVNFRTTPWVDWSNYWGTGDSSTKANAEDGGGLWDQIAQLLGDYVTGVGAHVFDRDARGVDGALMDLEYQRMELIRFNLFDNNTFEEYLKGRKVGGRVKPGATLMRWKEMWLPPSHPDFGKLLVKDGSQTCTGELIRHRTLTGICNDIENPAMGSTGQTFARNVEFETTFPRLTKNKLAKARHGDRLSLLRPDPQVISRMLFTRDQEDARSCNQGRGDKGSKQANCPYRPAPFFNVLAAYWIQFMTHDWFSHLDDGRNNQSEMIEPNLGCTTRRTENGDVELTVEERASLGCRVEDQMEAALVADGDDPPLFETTDGGRRPARAYRTSRNTVTAWWDASQIYGYDARSRRRIKRDPDDPAKLLMVKTGRHGGAGERFGYLPVFGKACGEAADGAACDPIRPEWVGQEAVAFPDNWSVGLSFFHNVFAREHNNFVDKFRHFAQANPKADSGLRNPNDPDRVITYSGVSDDELFEAARLVVAALIAKIHTIEWTPQLLYDEPLFIGMNSNWSGLFENHELASEVAARLVSKLSRDTDNPKKANLLYSAFNAGPGIVGFGSRNYPTLLHRWLGWDEWNLRNLHEHVNGGTNHFGSPFNFPEEFVSVYRLHPLLPDLLEYRQWNGDPNQIMSKIAVIDTFRGAATSAMHDNGLANWALSMGRQRLGALSLKNHPQFLQNLDLRPRLDTKIDIAALDIIRDRERGIPRFNEFRRQVGLRQLTSFDDFIDKRLADKEDRSPEEQAELKRQRELVTLLREIYGRHRCNASKVITAAQLNEDGSPINDCLGHPDGAMVDNIEDLDTVVGWLAETTRPHGFAISETQFHIFIINASRRLFSDRFFTSSFRPEFYTILGIDWVNNNGPDGKQYEQRLHNGHKIEVSPLKRVLLRAMPELAPELEQVVNTFDPWARDRGKYYSLQWKPRPGAEADEAFAKQ